jgi:hypothetical protein
MATSRLQTALVWASGALGVAAIASWILVAAAHIDDAYEVDHVAGGWMALAEYLAHGTLYPRLFDGVHYGGTRYMPLQIVLHGGLSRITGEYLVSGKVLVLVFAALLLALVVWVTRRLGAPWPLALGFAGVLLVTPAGLYDATAIRGDVLPAALQLAAVAIVFERPGDRRLVAAAALCALAFLAKTSALWAPAAILVWLLLRRERRPAAVFAVATAICVAAGLGAAALASGGRIFENVFGLLGAGPGLEVHGVWTKLLSFLETKGDAVWLLLPFAALAVLLALRRPTLYQLALLAAAAILVVVMTDPGSDFNHLIDVEVLTVVVVAELWADAREPVLRLAIVAVLVWGLGSSFVLDLEPQAHAAASALVHGTHDPRYAREPLPGRIGPGADVLSEDPYVEVARGRLPVVLDPFMLLRVLDRHRDLRRGLVRRIERREFDDVVLIVPLDPNAPRWRTLHFGPEVARAIDRNYELAAQVGRYWLYRPRKLPANP